MSCRIVFIGAGNLATRLSLELQGKGYITEQVYSRTESSAKELAVRLNARHTTNPADIVAGAGIYFIALKDSAWDEVLPHVAFGDSLVVHCSGSMPLSALKRFAKNTGVFYPLQTFSKDTPVHFKEIPVFIESASGEIETKLREVAESITGKVSVMDSESRLHLHVSAVFACNFVNHLYALAAEILSKKEISFEVLHPLIMETAGKIQHSTPVQAQTGPAVRFDQNVISAHLKALESDPGVKELYERLSESIYNYHKKM
jgi:predicted short-subunit dehydrogenase-like oxidoreductase (DUF2520 family)